MWDAQVSEDAEAPSNPHSGSRLGVEPSSDPELLKPRDWSGVRFLFACEDGIRAAMTASPGSLLFLPILLWVLIEVCLPERESIFWLGQWAGSFIGTAVAATVINTVFLRRSAHGPSSRLSVIRDLPGRSARVAAVISLQTILIAGASFALIYPGIYLATRYSLAIPAAAHEGLSPMAALRRSWSLTEGRSRGLTWAWFLGAVAFFPLLLLPDWIAPGGAGSVWRALGTIPLHTFQVGLLLSQCVLYRLLIQVMQPHSDSVIPTLPIQFKWRRVTGVAAAVWVIGVAACVTSVREQAARVERGDLAWEVGHYADAMRWYHQAAYWSPDDAYVQYSLGWAYVMTGDVLIAEPYFERAVWLDPENPVYLTDHARVLIGVGEPHRAIAQLEAARINANPALLEEIETLERTAFGDRSCDI